MITFLEGLLTEKELSRIVLNVSGIGYEIFIPLSTYEKLPKLDNLCHILTHHHITEADQKLFGFISQNEKIMFKQLLSINGIGPKIAIGALSSLPVTEIQNALSCGNVDVISSISGIGKKTAERIIVELRDSFEKNLLDERFKTGNNSDTRLHDAALALIALGHSHDASSKMIKNVAKTLSPEMTVEEIIRSALTK
ncbi:MAG: Holliday junction branch migration protein RuvA [Pontiellaceae bacterium]